ncbi:MAG TPA: acyl carrier protein [Kofleriaceae bacterium]|nr:acyl carrier protein [Kofleriaceae bacterium]
MMSEEQMIERFRTILAEVAEREVPVLGPETEIRSIGVDSIAMAEVVARLEDELGIEVPAEAWLSVSTVRDLLRVATSPAPSP